MGLSRDVFNFMKNSSIAHGKWQYEASMNILKSKKKLIFLALLVVPIIVMSIAFANAPASIGGHAAFAPSFYSPKIFLISISIGIIAGLITGCLGAGGGFIITPALMAVGIKGILAIGTDLFHIFATAIMGTTVHKKLGNVNGKLAASFLVGSLIGATLGGLLNRALFNYNPLASELFISALYAILLGYLGFYALADFLKSRNNDDNATTKSKQLHALGKTATRLQKIKVAPMIQFDQQIIPGGRKISGWIVAIGGLFVGILASIMGVGGGFVTFPMFVYVFGVSSMTTVGTDVFQIIFTAGYASITQYAQYGYVFYTLATGMLIGSLVGIQVGALTTKIIKDIQIRGFYAIAILAGFINRATALPKKLNEMEYIHISRPLANGIATTGIYLFWIVVIIFGTWVFSKFFLNFKKLRGGE